MLKVNSQKAHMNNWMSALSEDELKYIAPSLFICDDDPEKAAIYMYREGSHRIMASAGDKEKLFKQSEKELKSRPPKKYWEQVKKEIFLLICTDDSKYKDLRKKLSVQSDKGTSALVGIIAVSIGSVMGVEATIVSGFCAVALQGALKIGMESYCSCAE